MIVSVSLHARIHQDIETRILSGELKPGDKIPSEAELMAHYGCARMTVSKALSALSTAGLLHRRKRAGSFVAQPRVVTMVLDVPDLAAELVGRGQTYSYRLLRRDILDSTREAYAAQHMGDVGAVPEIADQDFTVDPPGTWLLKHIPWTKAENRIGASGVSHAHAQALGIRPGAPCLCVQRHTWRGADTVPFVRQVFVAGAYELVARFGPTRVGAG